MTETPVDLDKHRGMASQKATDIRRGLAEVEANAKIQRDRQGILESQLLSTQAASWPEAAAKARYVLNLYAAGLAPTDTHHRDLVAAVLADFARLSDESSTKKVCPRTRKPPPPARCAIARFKAESIPCKFSRRVMPKPKSRFASAWS